MADKSRDNRIRMDGKEYVFVDTDGDGVPDAMKEVKRGFLMRMLDTGDARRSGGVPPGTAYDDWEEEVQQRDQDDLWEAPDEWGGTHGGAYGEGEFDDDLDDLEAPKSSGCMTAITFIISAIAFVMYLLQGGIDVDKVKRTIEDYSAPFTGDSPDPAPDAPPQKEQGRPGAPAEKASEREAASIPGAVAPTPAPERRGRAPLLYLAFDGDVRGHEASQQVTTRGEAADFAPGVHGKALRLSGDSLVMYPLDMRVPNGYTLEFWVRFDAAGKWLLRSPQTVVASDIIDMPVTTPSRANVYYRFAEGGYVSVHLRELGVSLTPGRWYHFAFVHNARTRKYLLYVNGAVVLDRPTRFGGAWERFADHIGTLYVGNTAAGDAGFDGAIDEVYVYDYARAPKYIRNAAQAAAPAD